MAPEVPIAAAAAAPASAKLSLKGQRQKTNMNCVPTASSMSLSTFGVNVSQDTLAKQMGTSATKGTTGAQARPVLNSYAEPLGYSYGYADVSTASSMMTKVSYDVGILKRAPTLGVWAEKLPWNPQMTGTKVGHAIVLYGYDRKAGTITVYDPSSITGGTHTIAASALAADSQPNGMFLVTGRTDVGLSTLGDQTGDGTADAVAVDQATGKLWLYPGPTFAATNRKAIGLSGWTGMAELTGIGDLTGDGRADLIAAQKSDGTLWLYPGGDNKLGTRIKIGNGGWTGMEKLVGVTDITGDGKPDLLAVRKSDGTLRVYPGGKSSLGTPKQLGSGWGDIRSLTLTGDITGDGVNDLIGVQGSTGVMYVYAGRATGYAARQALTSGWNGSVS
jgi:hypothetical protein